MKIYQAQSKVGCAGQRCVGQQRRWFAAFSHLWVKSQLEQTLMAENSRRGSTAGCKGHLVETRGSLHDILSQRGTRVHFNKSAARDKARGPSDRSII